MSDQRAVREIMERARARLREEAAAKQAAADAIDQELAEIDRAAAVLAKYNLVIVPGEQGGPDRLPADATIASLIAGYKAHLNSPYKTLRYRTRLNYESLLRRIQDACGGQKLVDFKKSDIQALYDASAKLGKLSQAHSFMTMLRGLVHFGATNLENSECVRLSVILHALQFTAPKARTDALTAEQAMKIIDQAHKMGLHSIALGQAFQFDCKLKQRDVIGEWVPQNETGVEPTDIFDGNMKWIRGLRWAEVDTDLVLRHTVSHNGKPVALRLSGQIIAAELRRIRAERGGTLPTNGAIIVREETGLPWDDLRYRRAWRKVADECGIPKTVRNMDNSRARAVGGENSPTVEAARK